MKKSVSFILISIISSFYILSTSSCEKLDELTGSSKPGKISGVVTDSLSGYALSNVTITTVPPTSSVETDNEGAYVIEDVEKGDYIVKAAKQDYNTKSTSATVSADKTTIVSFVLGPTVLPVGSIAGTVINSMSSMPIAGASISTVPATQMVTTDNQGKFFIHDVPVRSYTVNVTADGYQNGSQTTHVSQNDTAAVAIMLSPVQSTQFGSIAGKISNATTSAPVANANIFTSPASVSVKSDADGNYRLSNIPIGTYAVTASLSGFSSATSSPVTVSSGMTEMVNLQIIPSGTGSGSLRVTAMLSHMGGLFPIPDVHVIVTPGNYIQTTDTSGKASFTSLPLGQYIVHCEHPALVSAEQPVTLTSSDLVEISIVMTIKPDSPGAIDGTVRDANTMTPLPNVTLTLTTDNNRTAVSGSDGTYNFDNVLPGQHSVTAHGASEGYQSMTLPAPVSAGMTTTVDFMLVASLNGTGKFYGTVLDPTGRGVVAMINISGPQASSASTDASGRYETGMLPFGTYQLTVTASGFQSQTMQSSLSAEQTAVEVNFLLGSSSGSTIITGRIVNELKLPVQNVLVELQNPVLSSITGPDGMFELKGEIPPGTHQLKITKEGYLPAAVNATVLQMGQTVSLGDIALTPSGGTNTITITGKTVSIASMRGVSNTMVTTLPTTSTAFTGTDGSFSIENVVPGSYGFNLSHTQYIDYRVQAMTFPLAYPLQMYMFYGKYTASQTAYYPMVSTWQDWKNNYWGSATALTDYGSGFTENRFGVAEHARYLGGATYLSMPPTVDTLAPGTAVMISCWVKTDPVISQPAAVVSWSNAAGNSGWSVMIATVEGKTQIQIHANNTNGTVTSFEPVFDNNLLGRWIMVTAGFRLVSGNSYQAVLYVDGVKRMDQTQSLPEYSPSAWQMMMGRGKKGTGAMNYFKGAVDDFRLFRSFLSDTEIIDLYSEE